MGGDFYSVSTAKDSPAAQNKPWEFPLPEAILQCKSYTHSPVPCRRTWSWPIRTSITEINGEQSRTVPHVLNGSIPGPDSEAFMLACKPLIAVSNGSALVPRNRIVRATFCWPRGSIGTASIPQCGFRGAI